jgi:hypothetical protein
LWLLSLLLLKNVLAFLVQCHLLFLQWKSTLIRTSQRRRQKIIYTFKKQIISKNDDEKGVKDVYYMTHHVHVLCVSFSFEKGRILTALLF